MTDAPDQRSADQPSAGRVTRRASLARFGGLVVTALGAGAGIDGLTGTAEGSGGPAAVAQGLVSCVLTPELTEGPYYIAGEKVRRNITEGKPGAALELRLGVLDASTCRPLRDATVDIWHCDAGGIYSGFVAASTGGTPGGQNGPTDKRAFLRGVQPTNAQGIATFQTIYPGWYRGRAVHIHVMVHLGGNVVHTGQLFFSDALTDAVYKRSPYTARPIRDLRNADDSIYKNGGSKSMVAVSKSGTGYVGKVTMGVHRT
jgi:protocatechuate 3,4-dioxygenase beta subunit